MTETVRAITCPQCGGSIGLRAAGLSVSLVCEHCGTTLDATHADVRVIAAAHEAMHRPGIPLGTRGTLRGEQWEVIGYLERSDGYNAWHEYLLFNPYAGYRFLVDDGRCFSLGEMLDRVPDRAFTRCGLDGHVYDRFGSTYDAWVTFVVGEFYWRVAVGERVRATDFVRSGAMLALEENDQERSWTLLTLLDPGEAEDAFGMERRSRMPGGTPSPHEPSPWAGMLREAAIVFVAALVALVAIIVTSGPSQRVLLNDTITLTVDAPPVERVLGAVTLPARYNRVTIAADASALYNSWVDLDYSLVNRRTQRSFDVYSLAERYHGSDSDGPWSEGDPRPRAAYASIPGGAYDVVVEASAHGWTGAQSAPAPTPSEAIPVSIRVTAGGSFGGPILLAIVALSLWPIMLMILHASFEQRRMAPLKGDD